MTLGPVVRPRRFEGLDALRGALALAVMVFHLLGWLYEIELLAVGTYSVYLFFVLSGFAMTWAYGEATAGTAIFPLRDYWRARLVRIIPLWWVVVIATVVSALPEFVGWRVLAENLTLTSALTPTESVPLGGWSIEIELVWYLLFPVLLMLLRTKRSVWWAFVAALVIRLLYVQVAFPVGAKQATAEYYQLPTFLAFFVGGMLIARLQRDPPPIGTMAAGGAAVALLGLIYSLGGLSQQQLLAGPLALILTLLSVALVMLVSMMQNPASASIRLVATTLGSVSYGVYLLHPLVYTAVTRLELPAIAALVTTIFATFILAWLSYRYFERPLVVLARNHMLSVVASTSWAIHGETDGRDRHCE